MRPDPQRPEHPNVMRIGGEDSTIPAWYVVGIDDDGRFDSVTCKVLIEPEERAAIVRGADLELTLYGGELPWSIRITEDDEPQAASLTHEVRRQAGPGGKGE